MPEKDLRIVHAKQEKPHHLDSAKKTSKSTQKMASGVETSTRLPAWTHVWGNNLPAGLVPDFQTKHIVSQPGDPSEQEAEQVANQVMGMANSGPSIIAPSPNHPGALTSLAASTVQLSPVPAMVQRAPLEEETASSATTTENAPAPEAAATKSVPETAPPDQTVTPSLIVDDAVDQLAPGQMKKSDFLAQLRGAVCTTTEEALKGTIWSAAGCPWVDYWFGFYSNRDSQQVERALRRYAPDTANVTSASDYIPIICERVRRAITVWSTTGEVTGVPEGLSTDISAAPADVGTGKTSASTGGAGTSSSSQTVAFKGREGGARETSSPQAMQNQLGTGRSLDSGVKSQMESAFSVDFSQVRVHTDAKAAGLSESLNARAFTVGRNVAFGAGEYQPGTLVGDALIAHELAHVVQQGGTSSSVSTQKEGALYNSLEEDADVSAVGAVVSLWSGAKGILANIAQNAMPTMRSGLRLQSCKSERSKEIDRLANLQFSFLEEKRKKDEEEERKAQIEAEKKAGAKTPKAEPKVDIGKVVEKEVKKGEGDVLKGGFAKNPVDQWTSLSDVDKNNWKNRATVAWNNLVTSVKGTELEKVAQGKSVSLNAEKALKNGWYAWQDGNTLVVGMAWVKDAEADPKNVWDNLAHEMGGHFELGTSYQSEIMGKVIEMLPQAVRDRLKNDEDFRVQFYATYQYADTEIYAAVRQLRYRYPLAGPKPTTAGIDPYQNIEIRLNSLRDNFHPDVARAILRELKRRIDLNSEMLQRDKDYFTEQVKKKFGDIF